MTIFKPVTKVIKNSEVGIHKNVVFIRIYFIKKKNTTLYFTIELYRLQPAYWYINARYIIKDNIHLQTMSNKTLLGAFDQLNMT